MNTMNEQLLQIHDWEGLAREANFRPASMAALCTTSLRQLQRFFARHFHQTPRDWTRELRCRIARQLISQGWSSKAVVNELGFVDHAHLCHEFRTFYGAPPRTFAPMWENKLKRRSYTEMSPKNNEIGLRRFA